MITKGDDYPLHQTPEPIAYTGANRNFYDRFFFNGYNRSGDVYFAAALGVYPYVNVMDAAFSVVVDGVQHNVYGSKAMHMERLDLRVGNVEVQIVEPLEVLRLICSDIDNGITADLRFMARTLPHEEPRFTRHAGSQVFMDVTRLTQFGTWEGWIEVKGRRIEVDSSEFRGTRDRSWGIRGVGQADPQPNPERGEQQFYWLWAPINFDGFASHWFVNDDAAGEPWNSNATFVPLKQGGAEMPRIRSWTKSISYQSGTRHASSMDFSFIDDDGGSWDFELTPKWHFYMRGIGYTHETWRHGLYHGELETGYDEFNVSERPATDLHIQAMCDVTLSGGGKQYQGEGILEQLIVGPHAPSGFTDILDMAP